MAPLHPTLKGTLLAEGEWDILATDPRSWGVKGNRGADERERNYRPKTKSKPVCKQLFWWEVERGFGKGGIQSRSRHFSPASFVSLITSTSWSCEAEVRLPLAEPRFLSDGDWLGPAGTGSDSKVPTVLPVFVGWDG